MQADGIQWMAQRAIVLQVLRNDHPEQWSRAELEQAISDIRPRVVGKALAVLTAEGVVVHDDETITASRCARHLDALELVSI